MSDLGTFHRLLVQQLVRISATRLQEGVAISEIRDSLLPYRRFRNALSVQMEEDYDALLLQLAAGDDGLAMLDDAKLLKLFQAERRSPNPDLLQLDLHGAATLTLDAALAERALHEPAATPEGAPVELPRTDTPDDRSDASWSDAANTNELPLDIALAAVQPAAAPPPAEPSRPVAAFSPPPTPTPAATHDCIYCGGTLPIGRAVRFCPHCGQNQKTMPCPECGAEAEIGWKHCVSCGSGLPTV